MGEVRNDPRAPGGGVTGGGGYSGARDTTGAL